VNGQASPGIPVRERRLLMLVMACLLVLALFTDEMGHIRVPASPAMDLLTLALIVLMFADGLGRHLLRIGAMALLATGLVLATGTPITPVGYYVVMFDATQLLRLRTAAVIVAAMTGVWFFHQFTFTSSPNFSWVGVAFNIGFLVFGFGAFYVFRRLRDEQFRVSQLLAELEASREREVEAARVGERARLARDIHDVLAHSLTALIVQLDSARMLLTEERASEEAVGSVLRARHLAQAGLDETRRAVGTLRGDRVPGAALLPGLVADFERDSGLDCAYRVEGEPLELASEAQLALYRTAQEALTNVRKHARADRVEVRLRYRDDGAELTVDDYGQVPAPGANGAGTGYGLDGMRERAELLGGSLEAGPRDGGFRVRLWLPA
jgi:signal transduction histidine kinase